MSRLSSPEHFWSTVICHQVKTLLQKIVTKTFKHLNTFLLYSFSKAENGPKIQLDPFCLTLISTATFKLKMREKKRETFSNFFHLKKTFEKTHTDCVSLSVADTGLVGWPNMLGEFSETAHNPNLPPSQLATPTKINNGGQAAGSANQRSQVPRLKRLNNAQQHNVYTLCHTAEGTQKFRCTECSRTFNLKCTLLRHVRHQHQGRFVPHPCGQCGQVFKRTDHLKVHMRKIHKMTSQSRNQRGQQSQAQAGGGGGSATAETAMVAAAVANMANTQPLALIKHETHLHQSPEPKNLTTTQERLRADSHDSDTVPVNNN